MGLMARNLRDVSNWIIGQVALGVEARWGEDRLGEFARLLGFTRSTIYQYRWVVKKFGQNYNPGEGLPWSYYRLAAGTDDPQKTIEHINDNNFSLKQASDYIKGNPVIVKECRHNFGTITTVKCANCFKTLKQENNEVL